MPRFILAFLIGVLPAVFCAAQTPPPSPVIESNGQATIYIAPSNVEFHFQRLFEGETLESAMDSCAAFEGALRNAVTERDLRPQEMQVSSPAIDDINQKLVRISARLKFAMTGYANPDTGSRQFAGLCDRLFELSKAIQTEVTGPIFSLQNKEGGIKQAIAAATESAFPQADAVAGTLRTPVSSVDSVRVTEVAWNQPLDTFAHEPTLRQISCTAKVTVLYTVSTP